jgi:putative aminopeptidase FrvX
MDKKQFLEEYLNATSPTGLETAGQKIWLDYIAPYVDETYTDIYGTAVGVINPGKDYKVVIEAHADEIGWTVSHIDGKGFIRVVRNGGSDHHIAPGTPVQILGEKGIVNGHFGWLAIHERKGGKAELTPKVDNLFIDVEASSKEEVEEMGIFVGTPLVYDTKFQERNGRYISRALDNRIGGYIIAQVARKLKEKGIELPYSLYVVNAVQEEIGLVGAHMIANSIKPDVAIITDVCHDTSTPLMDPISAGDTKCGEGPVLFRGADIQLNLHKQVVKTAEDNGIKFQRGSYNGNSGTDTGAFYKANGGVACQLISLPLKYMHTTVETVHKKDVKAVIRLIYKTLQSIEYKQDFRYIKNTKK